MTRPLSRRSVLAGLATTGLVPTASGLLLPRRALAAPAASDDLRFVFVFASGGWDTTRVFAPEFDNGAVDMEAGADRATAGNISFVDHPDRPSVGAFMAANHGRMLVINGILVRAIAHEICTMLALTGTSSGFDPDWPTILAASGGSAFTLPHLVIGGPSFSGDLVASVARTGSAGQLEALLSGDILEWNDQYAGRPSAPFESRIDDFVRARVAGRAQSTHSPVDQALATQYADATAAAEGLRDYRYVIDFTGGDDLGSQAQVAADALALGLCRSVTLGHTGSGGLGWDSHANNDDAQSANFESLFSGLTALMALLDQTAGPAGGSLADQTVVVVMSEMARTPALNATLGKDHWPYTSMMLLGPGLSGDRVIGAYDANFAGEPLDLSTGDVGGDTILSAEAVGAGLLQLAGIDPGEWVSGTDPLSGMLA